MAQSNTDKWFANGYQAALGDVFQAYLRGGGDVENGFPAMMQYIADNYREARTDITLFQAGHFTAKNETPTKKTLIAPSTGSSDAEA